MLHACSGLMQHGFPPRLYCVRARQNSERKEREKGERREVGRGEEGRGREEKRREGKQFLWASFIFLNVTLWCIKELIVSPYC